MPLLDKQNNNILHTRPYGLVCSIVKTLINNKYKQLQYSYF